MEVAELQGYPKASSCLSKYMHAKYFVILACQTGYRPLLPFSKNTSGGRSRPEVDGWPAHNYSHSTGCYSLSSCRSACTTTIISTNTLAAAGIEHHVLAVARFSRSHLNIALILVGAAQRSVRYARPKSPLVTTSRFSAVSSVFSGSRPCK